MAEQQVRARWSIGPQSVAHVHREHEAPVGRPRQRRGSFRRLASLDVEALCVPHGEPVSKGASEVLRAATPENDRV
ncbi:hypothetical protein [Streptomyces sp. NPDC048411]|uniref:hypothetical protein n=1 Tax=Streptomyces sp. NPDC048411 TaxID=3157206 RepID=UPI0034531383